MIQFYKKRDFGSLISDTFNFFAQHGKNYLKNYFYICGILSIIFVAIAVIGYREFFMQLMGSNLDGETYLFEQYFQNNLPILILVVGILLIFGILISVLSFCFPVFYLKRLTETGNTNIKPDELIQDFKSNSGKIIILILGMIFIVAPLVMVFMGLSVALMLLIVGFFLLLFAVPAIVNINNFLMYDYFNTNKGFFNSLGTAIKAQFSYPKNHGKSPFWKYWGSMAILMFINQIVLGIFTMIPMMIFQFSLISSMSEKGGFEENPFDGAMGITFFILYGISLVVSFLLNNVILVASGLMYYDHRTDLHQKVDLLEIESIGQYEN